jgi:hypothetical protein
MNKYHICRLEVVYANNEREIFQCSTELDGRLLFTSKYYLEDEYDDDVDCFIEIKICPFCGSKAKQVVGI